VQRCRVQRPAFPALRTLHFCTPKARAPAPGPSHPGS
jgi:hypothetical protein